MMIFAGGGSGVADERFEEFIIHNSCFLFEADSACLISVLSGRKRDDCTFLLSLANEFTRIQLKKEAKNWQHQCHYRLHHLYWASKWKFIIRKDTLPLSSGLETYISSCRHWTEGPFDSMQTLVCLPATPFWCVPVLLESSSTSPCFVPTHWSPPMVLILVQLIRHKTFCFFIVVINWDFTSQ